MAIIRKYFYIYLCVLIFSCSSTPLSRFESMDIPEDIFGIVHAGKTNTREEYIFLDELGVKWILYTFNWHIIESQKDNFDFSFYDEYVETAKQEGKKIIGTLGYDVHWLSGDSKRSRNITPEKLQHYINYVEKTVQHFKGRVDAWQIWNEPNLYRFWKGSRKDFFELTRQAAQKIREVDPDVYIIGGAFVWSPRGFIKAMHKAGAMENLDGLSFHPYSVNPSGSMRIHDKFINILSEINFTGDVWITEVGHPTGGWYPTRVSLNLFPSYVIKTMAGAAARGPRVVMWYQLVDHHNLGEAPKFSLNSESFFGIAYPNFQRKDAAWAFQLCAANLPGSHYTSDYPIRENSPKSIISLCFLEGSSGNNTLIIWNDSIISKKINLYLPAPAYIYNISTGEKTPLEEETRLNVNNTPLFITWQGEAIPLITKEKK